MTTHKFPTSLFHCSVASGKHFPQIQTANWNCSRAAYLADVYPASHVRFTVVCRRRLGALCRNAQQLEASANGSVTELASLTLSSGLWGHQLQVEITLCNLVDVHRCYTGTFYCYHQGRCINRIFKNS